MLVVLVGDVLFQRGGEGDGVRAPEGQREDIPVCGGRGVSGVCVKGERREGGEVRSHGGFEPQGWGLLGMWEVWEEGCERG